MQVQAMTTGLGSSKCLKKKKSLLLGQKGLIIWTVTLVLLVYGVFVYFPIGYGLFTSFFAWNPFRDLFTFVGLDNYVNILSKPEFWQAALVTVLFTIGSLVFTVGLGLLLATFIQYTKKGASLYRGVYFLPVIAPVVGTSMLWRFIFNYDSGFINSILMAAATAATMKTRLPVRTSATGACSAPSSWCLFWRE